MPLLILVSILFSGVAFSQSVEPGFWQATTTVNLSGTQLNQWKDKSCVDSEDAKDIKKAITKNLAKSGCSAPKWETKGNKVEIELKCDSEIKATGKMTGTVEKKSYDLKGTAKGTFGPIPAEIEIVMAGKWLKAECPK